MRDKKSLTDFTSSEADRQPASGFSAVHSNNDELRRTWQFMSDRLAAFTTVRAALAYCFSATLFSFSIFLSVAEDC